MRNWNEYSATTVRFEKTESGSRLLSEFDSDYQRLTGKSLCIECRFEQNYPKYLEEMKMAEQEKVLNSGFELKIMYNGIPLDPFKSNVKVSNRNLTDEHALHLLKNHKRGKDLFSKLPNNVDELINPEKSDQDLNLKELRQKYPHIIARGKKEFLKELAESQASNDDQ